jgi:hypothetical protein
MRADVGHANKPTAVTSRKILIRVQDDTRDQNYSNGVSWAAVQLGWRHPKLEILPLLDLFFGGEHGSPVAMGSPIERASTTLDRISARLFCVAGEPLRPGAIISSD